MKLQQMTNQPQPKQMQQQSATLRSAYKMADFTKKMSPDNPTQILTGHDLGNLRALQRVIATAPAIDDNNHSHSHSHSNGNGTINSHNNGNHNSNGGNLVFSTIPLEGHALLIQPSQLLPTTIAGNSLQPLQQQQQQRGATFTATNGLRSTNGSNSATANLISSPAVSSGSYISITNHNPHHNNNNTNNHHITSVNNNSNNNSLSNFLTKATILTSGNTKGAGKIIGSSNINNINTSNASGSGSMPTSKYVLLQPNGNGQFTTFEGPTPAAAAAAAAASNGGNANSGNTNVGAPSVGNIVLLATEPLDLNGSTTVGGETARVIATATAGDNDEELRPLAWLNDRNLIKGIVTTTAGGAGVVKRNITTAGGIGGNNSNSNICIVNASNAHELIEELPPHVTAEEHMVASSNSINNSNNSNRTNNITASHELKAGTQITTLSVSEFQQFKRFGNIIAAGTPITLLPQSSTSNMATTRKDSDPAPAHIFSNIGAISATTTVHVGPSGTTTVVEYKSNGNYPTTQPRQLLNSGNNNATTITATNLSSSNHTNSNYVPSNSSTSVTTPSASTVSASSSIGSIVSTSNNYLSNSAVVTTATPAAISVTLSTPASGGATNSAGAGVLNLNLPKQLSSLPGGIVTLTNSNSTPNTIAQGQQQKQPCTNNNISNNSSSGSSSTTTTTHHPHKKYLREKMNVLDHGGGVADSGGIVSNNANTINNSPSTSVPIGGNVSAASITVVASPASSNSSMSSSVSSAGTSASTAAVNGGNSPVAKTFYASNSSINSNNNNGSTSSPGVAINFSNPTCSASSTPPLTASYAAVAANAISSPPITTSGIPAYTFLPYQSVASSSPALSSPEPANSKDYFPIITAQQQQQQQMQQQRNSMRSPNSTYSSYDNDSLKDFEISNSGTGGGRHHSSTPHQTLAPKVIHNSNSGVGCGAVTPQKQKHPNNVPYDPYVHTHNKPPYSFSSLIFMAIEGSNEKALPVKEIYAWIMQHFPYFKTAPTGWKNSVRHNLSLNKSFVKVEKAPNMGKGSLWRVEPHQRQNLIQALNRSPYCPNAAVDKISMKSPSSAGGDAMISYDTVDSIGSVASTGGASAASPVSRSSISHMNSRIDPRLFPNLSKVIGEPNMLNDVSVPDAADDEHPSDYSTTNHNHSNNNNSNNKFISHTNSPNVQNGSGCGVALGANGNDNTTNNMLGPFGSYESIERLARDCGADSIDDVNAATAMLALKHGPKVFTETFQNGAPVITSSPSEDHTYSAGGSGGGGTSSGSSTPYANGNVELNSNAVFIESNSHQHNSSSGDNQSNYTSSDTTYESSEENHNVTPEELEDQRRHREGVDALLSLSRSSVVDSSTSCSPNKRPSSTSVEEEHISASLQGSNSQQLSNGDIKELPNGNLHQHAVGVGKMALLAYSSQMLQHQQRQGMYEENDGASGNNTPSYYNNNNAQMASQHPQPHHQQQTAHHHIGAPAAMNAGATRKMKPLRSLRTKIKRKAPWMR